MVVENVVEWIIIPVIGGVGTVLILMGTRIHQNRKDSEDQNEQTQEELTQLKKELSAYQVDTEKRLGEFIRREELHSILDRVEERMEKQMNDLKDTLKEMLRQVIDKR